MRSPTSDTGQTAVALIQIARRIVLAGLALWLALMLWAQFLSSAPMMLVDEGISPELRERLEAMAGAPAGLFEGTSLTVNQPVSEILQARAGVSAALLAWAIGIALLAGAAGASLAVAVDRLEAGAPLVGFPLKALLRIPAMLWVALPLSGLAILLIYRLALVDRLLPASGIRAPGGVADMIQAPFVILPLLTLAGLPATLVAAGAYDYWRRGTWWAGAFGLLAGLGRAVLAGLAGLVLVEALFAIPGAGRLVAMALAQRDFPVLLGAIQATLLVAAGGAVLAAVGDGLARLAAPPIADSGPEQAPAGRQRLWLALGLLSLLIPVVVFGLSLAVDAEAARAMNMRGRLAPPSEELPWGGDTLGRSIYVRAMVGFRETAATTLVAVVVALPGALVGLALGVMARWRGAVGETLADLVLLPASALALLPLLLGAIAWRSVASDAPDATPPLGQLIGTLLLPRVALSMRSLPFGGQQWRWGLALRGIAGTLLLGAAAAMAALTALDTLGLGLQPPAPSLGSLLNDYFLAMATGASPLGLLGPLALIGALSGPCLLAGWALLRPLRRGQAIGNLYG